MTGINELVQPLLVGVIFEMQEQYLVHLKTNPTVLKIDRSAFLHSKFPKNEAHDTYKTVGGLPIIL